MRRTALLLVLVAVGVVLALVVRPPERPRLPGERGHRVFRAPAHAVRGIDVTLGERSFVARREQGGWTVDGKAADPHTAAALDDLVQALTTLRAVDVFRHHDPTQFGLDRPSATITLLTARGERRMVLGAHNAASTVIYARRDGDPRLLQIGVLLVSSLERVFFRRDGTRPPAP